MTKILSSLKIILALLLFSLCSAGYALPQDSVIISGRVTDYDGQPIDSCSIFWQSPSFDDVRQAITNKDGHYTARIPKGKYQSMGAINMSTYPHTVKAGLPEADQRLEFWAWDFIADRDTTSTSVTTVWKPTDYASSASPAACLPIRYTSGP